MQTENDEHGLRKKISCCETLFAKVSCFAYLTAACSLVDIPRRRWRQRAPDEVVSDRKTCPKSNQQGLQEAMVLKNGIGGSQRSVVCRGRRAPHRGRRTSRKQVSDTFRLIAVASCYLDGLWLQPWCGLETTTVGPLPTCGAIIVS